MNTLMAAITPRGLNRALTANNPRASATTAIPHLKEGDCGERFLPLVALTRDVLEADQLQKRNRLPDDTRGLFGRIMSGSYRGWVRSWSAIIMEGQTDSRPRRSFSFQKFL